MKLAAGFGVVVLAIIVALFFVVSWAVMLLLNVVLAHWHLQTADYTASMAIVGLSAILFGGSRVNTSKD